MKTAPTRRPIGFIVDDNNFLAWFFPLVTEFRQAGFPIYVYASRNLNRGKKNISVPISNPQHIKLLQGNQEKWYQNNSELASQLNRDLPLCVFSVEAQPFVNEPEPFANRRYYVYSLTHSVDNFHPKAISNNSIDQSIAPSLVYGDYLGWRRSDYLPLGSPKYDLVHKLSAHTIRSKYHLPKKYILIFAPNNKNNPAYLPPLILLRLIIKLRLSGYHVVIKGKAPRSHRWFYRYLAPYFLSQASYYPFIVHELIKASSGCISFDSTVIEEVLMLEKPLVNFGVRLDRTIRETDGNFKLFRPMRHSAFCLDLSLIKNNRVSPLVAIPKFIDHFAKSINFRQIQADTFFIPGGVSAKIVTHIKRTHKIYFV